MDRLSVMKKIPGLIGLLGLIGAQIALCAGFEPIRNWFYPLIWWSYILFIDGVIYAMKGNSLIISRTKEFWLMLPWSVLIWLIFESFNFFIQNWYYENVTGVRWQRWIGYAVSYATVLPAIFETTEFLETIGLYKKISWKKLVIPKKYLKILFLIGAVFLVLPIILPTYCFPLVWLSFIFLLEPANHWVGGQSLLKQGNLRKVCLLFTAGLICGILWEFWNYWARARWVYALPYFHNWRIFEMPVLGYLGFLPFAWECHAMYQFVSANHQHKPLHKIITGLLLIAFCLMIFYLIDMYTVKSFI